MNQRITWPGRSVAWVSQNGGELLIGLTVAALAVAAMLVLRYAGQRMTARDPRSRTWKSVIARVLARTSLVFMIVAALDVVANYTAAPPRIAHALDIAFIIVASLQAAVWARELVMGVLAHGQGEEAGESAFDNARAVIRVLVNVTVFLIAAIVILDNLGVNVTALIAGLGIGGIAIGLAAQGIFSDLFAALSILFDKPFKRGDTIRFGDSIGTVERIGLKTTRLRALSGEQMVMANTKLLEQEIRNLAEGQTRRTALTFGVTYQTSPQKLAAIPEIARQAVEARRGCAFARCALTGFGASSLEHELLYDTATIDLNVVAADRAAIMMAILGEFAKAKIDFAYPTQTTFTAAPDGTMIMPYAAAPAPAARARRKS